MTATQYAIGVEKFTPTSGLSPPSPIADYVVNSLGRACPILREKLISLFSAVGCSTSDEVEKLIVAETNRFVAGLSAAQSTTSGSTEGSAHAAPLDPSAEVDAALSPTTTAVFDEFMHEIDFLYPSGPTTVLLPESTNSEEVSLPLQPAPSPRDVLAHWHSVNESTRSDPKGAIADTQACEPSAVSLGKSAQRKMSRGIASEAAEVPNSAQDELETYGRTEFWCNETANITEHEDVLSRVPIQTMQTDDDLHPSNDADSSPLIGIWPPDILPLCTFTQNFLATPMSSACTSLGPNESSIVTPSTDITTPVAQSLHHISGLAPQNEDLHCQNISDELPRRKRNCSQKSMRKDDSTYHDGRMNQASRLVKKTKTIPSKDSRITDLQSLPPTPDILLTPTGGVECLIEHFPIMIRLFYAIGSPESVQQLQQALLSIRRHRTSTATIAHHVKDVMMALDELESSSFAGHILRRFYLVVLLEFRRQYESSRQKQDKRVTKTYRARKHDLENIDRLRDPPANSRETYHPDTPTRDTQSTKRPRADSKAISELTSMVYPNAEGDEFRARREKLRNRLACARNWYRLRQEFSMGILALVPCGGYWRVPIDQVEKMNVATFGTFIDSLLPVRGSFLHEVVTAIGDSIYHVLRGQDLQTVYEFEEVPETSLLQMKHNSMELIACCRQKVEVIPDLDGNCPLQV